jgi:hypothetical protein
MIEAFSKAKENWEVGFAVNASNLPIVSPSQARRRCQYRPCKRDLNMILIHGKPEIQQLQLAIVSVQEISSCRTVIASAPHILSQTIESGTFFCVSFRVISIGGPDVGL